MIQIAGIAAVCLLLTVLLRKENPTFALLVTVAGPVILYGTLSSVIIGLISYIGGYYG